MDLFALKSLLFLLSFVGCCAGQAVLPEGPVDAVVGRNVTLKTLVDKPVYTFIIWTFNGGAGEVRIATITQTGLNVNEPYKGRVSVNRTTGYLTLAALKPEDTGKYSMDIIKEDGSTDTGVTELRVLKPVSDVSIKSNLPEAIEHNSTVVLTCSAKGSFLKFTWTNGTSPVVADGKRIVLEEKELLSTLTITGVLRSDLVGPIYCTATNKLEKSTSAPFNLTVYYGPDEVTVSPMSPPQYIKSGSNFNLSCSALSNPPASFVWYHNQKMMEAGGAVLTLKVIEMHRFEEQVGNYTCRAKNTKTERIVPSPAVSLAVIKAISGTKITGPTATLIAGNSTANLSCQAAAGTVMTRTWQKDGKPLSASSRLLFAADMSSMMINLLQKEDNGEYKCVFANPISSDEASYKMVVNYGPEAPMVTGEKAVELNHPVKLTCSAASVPPANFTWKLNGTMTNVKTAVYAIDKAVYNSAGTYTCMALNSVTGKTTTYNHTLSVKAEGALNEGLSDGAIAGIVIAVLVALGAAIALIIYCRQKVPVESPY